MAMSNSDDGYIDFSRVMLISPDKLGQMILHKPPPFVAKEKESEIKEVVAPSKRKKKLGRKQDFTLNLIELYKQHECLWNTKHKDFLNLPLKNKIWRDIAKILKREGRVEYLKRYIHTLRYKVNLQKVQQLEAALHPDLISPEKLYYADQLNFLNHTLFNHYAFAKKIDNEKKMMIDNTNNNSHSLVNSSKSTLKSANSTVSERLRTYNNLRNCKETKRDCLIYEAFTRLKPTPVKVKVKTEPKVQEVYDDGYNDTIASPIDCDLSQCGTSSWDSFVLSVKQSKSLTKQQLSSKGPTKKKK